jgi:hypothetical protein
MPTLVRWLVVVVVACVTAMLVAHLLVAAATAVEQALPAIALLWFVIWAISVQVRGWFRR